MIPIVLIGAGGRMGRAVDEAARSSDTFSIRARVDRAAPPAAATVPRDANSGAASGVWSEDAASVVRAGDVVIEFSSPEGCRTAAPARREASSLLHHLGGRPERVGVFGYRSETSLVAPLSALFAGATFVPLNPRLPVARTQLLARHAGERRGLGESALKLGRSGRTGERPREEIGVHAIRGGSLVGDHAVVIAGDGEWIELRHVAEDRSAFAYGALAAARFVATAKPGLYTMDHVLGSK